MKSKWSGYRVSCILAILAASGCGGGPAMVPTSFASYNAKDGTFRCDQPDGWEVKGGGKQGPVWAEFASGAAVIKLKADLAGSLLGDAMGGSTAEGEQLAPELEPVHVLHEKWQETAADEFTDYKEVGPIAIHKVELGPARLSEFTAKSSFGTQLHGYRVTVMAHDKRVIVHCTSPETEWTALKPAFDRVLASLVRGDAP